jgi:hypothetical protein
MKTRTLILIAFFGALTACGDKAPEDVAAAPQPESAVETVTEAAVLPRTPSVEGARVFFITPADGATVSNPVTVEFGIEGMEVVKAGDNQPHSGHHHLLIDTGLPDLGLPIPADSQHVHFGDGSTSTEITLPPGEHTLQMLLGDHLHIPHNPPLSSAVITVTVE